jgi:xanthine dehydrogenase accessory factor
MAKSFFEFLSEIHVKRVPYAVATVIEVVGSTSAKTGSKALIDEKGFVITGWVGGGCAESTTCTTALECIASGQTQVIDIDLDDEVLGAGMPCGGHMRVFVEPFLPAPTLWIMGHGAVAEHLCQFADTLGYKVVVNDVMATRDKFPAATELIVDDLDYSQLNPDPEDFVVIATQHKGDHESISRALNSKANYIALIASRKRSRLVLDYLRDEGFSQDDIQRVMAPSGLDLGARVPAEIALSVASEMVKMRREGTGVHMRETLYQEPHSIAAAKVKHG